MSIMKRAWEEGWRSLYPGGGPPWVLSRAPKKKVRKAMSDDFRSRQRVPVDDGPGFHPVDDPRFLARYPALFQYLCVPPDPSDLSSPTAAITLFTEDGQVKAALNDRHTGLVCFVTNTTLEGVLSLLDGQLQEGMAEWRKSKSGNYKKRK